mgnify:CR=1 FL=1
MTVDGREIVGNSSGRAPLGGSEMEVRTSWMDRKPWESSLRRERDGSVDTVDGWLGESSVARERDGSVDTVDGWETVGKGAKRKRGHRWTDRKPWEIRESSVGRERDGSVDVVDGWETMGNMGNSLGRAPLGGSETEAWTPWTDGKPWRK